MDEKTDPIVFFEREFGKGITAGRDYTGRAVEKSAYLSSGAGGWVLEYVLPPEQGGANDPGNTKIVSREAHNERAGRMTFSIDGIKYQVRKDGRGGHGIFPIANTGLMRASSEWDIEFGSDAVRSFDFAGREIKKKAYLLKDSPFGWDTDHILPVSRGGTDDDRNKQIAAITTNREKSDKVLFFTNGCFYRVQKTELTDASDYAGGYDYSGKAYCVVKYEEPKKPGKEKPL